MQQVANHGKRKWYIALGVVLVAAGAIIVALTLAGTNGQDDSRTSPNGEAALDLQSYVGLSTEEAREKAASEGRSYEVQESDDRAQSEQSDSDVVLYTDNDRVVDAQAGSSTAPQDRPDNDTTGAESYIGLSEEDATEKARAEGYDHRIVARDGEEFMVTMDYREDRINFSIENGRVVKADFY